MSAGPTASVSIAAATVVGRGGVEPQGRSGYLVWQALFVSVSVARREKGCNQLVYLDNFLSVASARTTTFHHHPTV